MMDEKTQMLVNKLADEVYKQLGETLVSILLYGSAAGPRYIKGKSDINLLIVLKQVELGALVGIGETVAPYKKHGFADPVVVDQEYITRSSDVFPIEFEEIKREHKLVYGEDPLKEISVNRRDLRLQLERELKQSLLSLRQLVVRAPGFSGDFVKALAQAGKSVAAQVRAVSMLAPAPDKESRHDPVADLEKLLDANFPAIRWLIELRGLKSPPKKPEVKNILSTLLDELGHLVRWIDELEEFQA
jgi:hypothetical protein